MLRHLLRKKPIALDTIYAETFQLVVGVEEAQPVTIGKGCRTSYIERVATQLLDLADILT